MIRFRLHVADAGDEFDLLEQVGEIIEDERVGVLRRCIERLDHRAMTARVACCAERFSSGRRRTCRNIA